LSIKTFNPTSPGLRFRTSSGFDEITREKPEKSLTRKKKKRAGRNSKGRITVRHRGGGHKGKYRIIDWKRSKYDIPGKIKSIEYDPNRSARIALVVYPDGDKVYIICPVDLKVGDTVMSGPNSEIKAGNCLPLKNIPVGTVIHNVELKPGKGAQLVRSAGSSAQVMARDEKFCHIRLPSSEVRLISVNCKATVGQIGNIEHETITIGKAGRTRWMGRRPKVRGVAQNPVDHPHGGGEARSTPGRAVCTPWGKPTLGYRTRKKRKDNSMIVTRRKRKR